MDLPVRHMTLYKHGVGFYERRAELSGKEVELSFRVDEMNDILKSLTAIDLGAGQVLGVDYATPKTSEELLAGCSVRLDDDRSLRDLLISLRGRRVKLELDQGEQVAGTLVGLDEVAERQPLATSLVSLLCDETAKVQTYALERLQGVDIVDERGASDLRFFLQTELTREEYRQVTIRLTPGDHDLSVSYVAPAPTWRVSYRLVADGAAGDEATALLLAWGIFDNQLEEDLESISLSLVAGMPISFVYDLYNPFVPERPIVQEEARVAAAPVEFADAREVRGAEPRAKALGVAARGRAFDTAMMEAPAAPPSALLALERTALKDAAPIATSGEDLGELFQYVIETPVTVGRGKSAMVPIIAADLTGDRVLLYNGAKMPKHPVATLRLKNETALTLERGPVTVIEGGKYVGEAVLPFAASGGDLVVPFAVELSTRVREQRGSSREIRGLYVKGAYLHVEEWDLRWREVQVSNKAADEVTILVEHPRTARYDLYGTPEPEEQTDEHVRFEVSVPARGETTLRVQERRLMSRREELQKQSFQRLGDYLRKGLIDREAHDLIVEMLKLWEAMAALEERLAKIGKERQQIYEAQGNIRSNMTPLASTGKEGSLRARYVKELEASEDQIGELARQERSVKERIDELEAELKARLAVM